MVHIFSDKVDSYRMKWKPENGVGQGVGEQGMETIKGPDVIQVWEVRD